MSNQEKHVSSYGLENHGITNFNSVHWNFSTPVLVEQAVKRSEGHLSHLGPLVVRTGHHTGRSPNDRFVVKEGLSAEQVWWGKVNKPFDPASFDRIYHKLLAFLQGKDIFVQDCYAGADPKYRLRVRVVTTHAWHSMFARNMFIQALEENLADFVPDFTIINTPRFHAIPEVDGTRSECFILVNFDQKLILIGGTSYAGENKKSISRRFGTVLENVAMDYRTRRIDLDDDSLTENTRASYPLTHIPNIVPEGRAAGFLTA